MTEVTKLEKLTKSFFEVISLPSKKDDNSNIAGEASSSCHRGIRSGHLLITSDIYYCIRNNFTWILCKGRSQKIKMEI